MFNEGDVVKTITDLPMALTGSIGIVLPYHRVDAAGDVYRIRIVSDQRHLNYYVYGKNIKKI